MKITFKVMEVPKGKARPRFARVGEGVKTYTPKTTADYEKKIKNKAIESMMGLEPLKRAIKATFIFRMTVPKSWNKNRRTNALCGFEKATQKPDVDNLVKAVLDACNGVVFDDDSQIVRILAEKYYDETPCIEAIFEEV